MADQADASTFSGLLTILDSSRTSVSRACLAVEECIASNRDNLRGFFEQCFPSLLRRLFGYDGTSWLAQISKGGRDADAKSLLRLLSPSGPLFSAMLSADADGSIRFHFPRERLPTHTQMMLSTPAGRKVLESWPQYAKTMVPDATGKPHIHTGVTQYFLYWFAFYAMKGGDAGSSGSAGYYPQDLSTSSAKFGSSVRKAADVLNLRGKDTEPPVGHPYTALLRQLLAELLPRPASVTGTSGGGGGGAGGGSPVKPSPVATRGVGASGANAGYFRSPSLMARAGETAAARGLLFLSVMTEFWMTDGDEPVPVANAAALSERDRPAALWATSYEPPSEDSLEALVEIVRHISSADGGRPAQGSTAWLPVNPVHIITPSMQAATRRGTTILNGPFRLGAAAQPGVQAFSRRMFRLFHRAFTLWPDQRTIKPMLRLFVSYIAPWQTVTTTRSSSVATTFTGNGGSGGGIGSSRGNNVGLASQLTSYTAHMSDFVHRVQRHERREDGRYSAEWQQYVLANLPFYLVLVPLFLERSVSRISARGETSAADVLTAMHALSSAPELLDTLQRAEHDLVRYASSQPRRAEGPYAELLPWLHEQLHDWENAATATCLGDPSLVAPRAGAGALGGGGGGGGRNAPWPAMFSIGEGAAAWTGRDLLDLSARVLKEEPLKRLKKSLETVLPIARLPEHPESGGDGGGDGALYEENVPRLPKSTWKDVHYRGDPLKKPVTSFEIAPLARVLVRMSSWCNKKLGLDHGLTPEEESQPAEDRYQDFLRKLRRKGVRVNFRVFADVRTLAWLPIAYVMVVMVVRVLNFMLWALLTVPNADGAFSGGGGGGGAQQQRRQHRQYHNQRPQGW